MNYNKEEITEAIQKNRPTLKPSSIKQYYNHLNKLKSLFDADNYEFLKEYNSVMDKLKDKHYTTQRNSLNAVIVLLMALNEDKEYDDLIKEYQKIRDKYNEKYEQEQQSGIISDKQKNNFSSVEEIDEMLNKMEKDIKQNNIKKKSQLTPQEHELITAYTLFSILREYPLRNDLSGMIYLNKTLFKNITEEELEKTNYLINGKSDMTMILNEYKTSKKYGMKKVPVDKKTQKIFRMYIKIMNRSYGDVIFKTTQNNTITRNQISQMLLKVSKKYMGKSISTTLIRKSVLSNKFVDLKEQKEEQQKMADITGHSVDTMDKVYIKSNP